MISIDTATVHRFVAADSSAGHASGVIQIDTAAACCAVGSGNKIFAMTVISIGYILFGESITCKSRTGDRNLSIGSSPTGNSAILSPIQGFCSIFGNGVSIHCGLEGTFIQRTIIHSYKSTAFISCIGLATRSLIAVSFKSRTGNKGYAIIRTPAFFAIIRNHPIQGVCSFGNGVSCHCSSRETSFIDHSAHHTPGIHDHIGIGIDTATVHSVVTGNRTLGKSNIFHAVKSAAMRCLVTGNGYTGQVHESFRIESAPEAAVAVSIRRGCVVQYIHIIQRKICVSVHSTAIDSTVVGNFTVIQSQSLCSVNTAAIHRGCVVTDDRIRQIKGSAVFSVNTRTIGSTVSIALCSAHDHFVQCKIPFGIESAAQESCIGRTGIFDDGSIGNRHSGNRIDPGTLGTGLIGRDGSAFNGQNCSGINTATVHRFVEIHRRTFRHSHIGKSVNTAPEAAVAFRIRLGSVIGNSTVVLQSQDPGVVESTAIHCAVTAVLCSAHIHLGQGQGTHRIESAAVHSVVGSHIKVRQGKHTFGRNIFRIESAAAHCIIVGNNQFRRGSCCCFVHGDTAAGVDTAAEAAGLIFIRLGSVVRNNRFSAFNGHGSGSIKTGTVHGTVAFVRFSAHIHLGQGQIVIGIDTATGHGFIVLDRHIENGKRSISVDTAAQSAFRTASGIECTHSCVIGKQSHSSAAGLPIQGKVFFRIDTAPVPGSVMRDLGSRQNQGLFIGKVHTATQSGRRIVGHGRRAFNGKICIGIDTAPVHSTVAFAFSAHIHVIQCQSIIGIDTAPEAAVAVHGRSNIVDNMAVFNDESLLCIYPGTVCGFVVSNGTVVTQVQFVSRGNGITLCILTFISTADHIDTAAVHCTVAFAFSAHRHMGKCHIFGSINTAAQSGRIVGIESDPFIRRCIDGQGQIVIGIDPSSVHSTVGENRTIALDRGCGFEVQSTAVTAVAFHGGSRVGGNACGIKGDGKNSCAVRIDTGPIHSTVTGKHIRIIFVIKTDIGIGQSQVSGGINTAAQTGSCVGINIDSIFLCSGNGHSCSGIDTSSVHSRVGIDIELSFGIFIHCHRFGSIHTAAVLCGSIGEDVEFCSGISSQVEFPFRNDPCPVFSPVGGNIDRKTVIHGETQITDNIDPAAHTAVIQSGHSIGCVVRNGNSRIGNAAFKSQIPFGIQTAANGSCITFNRNGSAGSFSADRNTSVGIQTAAHAAGVASIRLCDSSIVISDHRILKDKIDFLCPHVDPAAIDCTVFRYRHLVNGNSSFCGVFHLCHINTAPVSGSRIGTERTVLEGKIAAQTGSDHFPCQGIQTAAIHICRIIGNRKSGKINDFRSKTFVINTAALAAVSGFIPIRGHIAQSVVAVDHIVSCCEGIGDGSSHSIVQAAAHSSRVVGHSQAADGSEIVVLFSRTQFTHIVDTAPVTVSVFGNVRSTRIHCFHRQCLIGIHRHIGKDSERSVIGNTAPVGRFVVPDRHIGKVQAAGIVVNTAAHAAFTVFGIIHSFVAGKSHTVDVQGVLGVVNTAFPVHIEPCPVFSCVGTESSAIHVQNKVLVDIPLRFKVKTAALVSTVGSEGRTRQIQYVLIRLDTASHRSIETAALAGSSIALRRTGIGNRISITQSDMDPGTIRGIVVGNISGQHQIVEVFCIETAALHRLDRFDLSVFIPGCAVVTDDCGPQIDVQSVFRIHIVGNINTAPEAAFAVSIRLGSIVFHGGGACQSQRNILLEVGIVLQGNTAAVDSRISKGAVHSTALTLSADFYIGQGQRIGSVHTAPVDGFVTIDIAAGHRKTVGVKTAAEVGSVAGIKFFGSRVVTVKDTAGGKNACFIKISKFFALGIHPLPGVVGIRNVAFFNRTTLEFLVCQGFSADGRIGKHQGSFTAHIHTAPVDGRVGGDGSAGDTHSTAGSRVIIIHTAPVFLGSVQRDPGIVPHGQGRIGPDVFHNTGFESHTTTVLGGVSCHIHIIQRHVIGGIKTAARAVSNHGRIPTMSSRVGGNGTIGNRQIGSGKNTRPLHGNVSGNFAIVQVHISHDIETAPAGTGGVVHHMNQFIDVQSTITVNTAPVDGCIVLDIPRLRIGGCGGTGERDVQSRGRIPGNINTAPVGCGRVIGNGTAVCKINFCITIMTCNIYTAAIHCSVSITFRTTDLGSVGQRQIISIIVTVAIPYEIDTAAVTAQTIRRNHGFVVDYIQSVQRQIFCGIDTAAIHCSVSINGTG